jgi:hypothetical protein
MRIVLRPGRLSSIVQVKRIEEPIFNSKEAAEQHGLQLCKGWSRMTVNRIPARGRLNCCKFVRSQERPSARGVRLQPAAPGCTIDCG